MTELHQGDDAPEFTLPTNGGGTLSLAALHGRKVVLYFYPKDDTSGCTAEACGFRDAYETIEGLNAIVIGVSPDSVDSHDRFVAKFGLPFALVADVDHSVAEQYGAWTLRKMYGKEYMGIQRSTFLIDENGKIAKVWPRVKADEHAGEVIAALQG